MNNPPKTLRELTEGWKVDLSRLSEGTNEHVAYDMVGRLMSVDETQWKEWYDTNELVAEIFDLAGDLEVSPTVYVSEEDRPAAWESMKALVLQLDQSL